MKTGAPAVACQGWRSSGTIGSPMGKFVVDASTVLHLVSTGAKLATEHKLLAPTLLRS